MNFDTIVFTQDELNSAIDNGFVFIAICDNHFILPLKNNIHYTAIGSVSAEIALTEAMSAARGISFDGFKPEFCKFAFVPRLGMALSHFTSSFQSSYRSSFSSSYTTSFLQEYEYEYEYGSFFSSYSSFHPASYRGSYFSSYTDPYQHIINPFILINGYGIDLI